MLRLSEKEIITRIKQGQPFSAQIDSDAFTVIIERYVPTVYTAIHHGHRVPSSLSERLLITERERQYEEDPYTGDFIDVFPIRLIVHDSRYFYDLNRRPEDCIYDEAWGKKVWKFPFSQEETGEIRDKHACYYRVLHCLVSFLEAAFSRAVLYDLHSYNYSRIEGTPPLFNIGTHFIDETLYHRLLSHLLKGLDSIHLDGVENRAVCDEVFRGRGYQAAFMNENHPDSLCIPLEIKKIFMDEQYFDCLDDVFTGLKSHLQEVLMENATRFEMTFTSK